MDVREQVKHKVAFIQDTIASIAEVQQQLKNNCVTAKSDIHSSISRQLETLRSREVWLLNQVDIIRHIKEERLQGQLACLLHELGGLQHLVQISQSCGDSCNDLNQELLETLHRLKDLEDKPIEDADIGFRADMSKLRRVIHSYGRVDAVGHTMEDYPVPDSLCGSLSELSLMGQPSGSEATVEFPPFETVCSLTEWLAQRDADDFVMVDEDNSFRLTIPEFDQQPGTSKPLESYFNQVNLSPYVEWLWDSGSFTTDSSYPYIMKYFREISNDVKDWLVSYEKSQQEEVEMQAEEEIRSKDCKADMCHCAGPPEGFVMQAIKIENLDLLTCMQDPVTHYKETQQPDKNQWLRTDSSTQMEAGTMPPIVLPSVSSSCRANEPCQDFTECVCDTNCAMNAITQSYPSFDQDQVLSYFHTVSKNPSNWLTQKPPESQCESVEEMELTTDPNCQWLKQDVANIPNESNVVFAFAQFNSVSQTSDWLHHKSDNNYCPTTNFSSPLDAYMQKRSDQVHDWLIKEAPSEVCNKEMLESQSEKDDEKAKWLHHTRSDDESNKSLNSSWEVVQKYHTQMANSDWIVSQIEPETKSEWLLDCTSSSSSSSPSVANAQAFKLFLQLGSSHDDDKKKWLKE